MRRRTIILLFILVYIMAMTMCVAQAQETYSLLYSYKTEDDMKLSIIIDANFFTHDQCMETGRLLLKQQYHEHSKIECIPTFKLTRGKDNGNTDLWQQRESNTDQSEDHNRD